MFVQTNVFFQVRRRKLTLKYVNYS